MNVLDILTIGSKILDRVLPDPAQKLAAQQKLLELQQAGDLAELNADVQLSLGQVDINKIEAASPSFWKSGWRPAVGWVGATALFVYYVPYCLVATVIWAHQCWTTKTLSPRPDLGITDLFGLLAGILGIGGMRSVEKLKGVEK